MSTGPGGWLPPASPRQERLRKEALARAWAEMAQEEKKRVNTTQ